MQPPDVETGVKKSELLLYTFISVQWFSRELSLIPVMASFLTLNHITLLRLSEKSHNLYYKKKRISVFHLKEFYIPLSYETLPVWFALLAWFALYRSADGKGR
jgi:hypothetical protein